METATTLVHKGAMPIAVHAIRSFARHFSTSYRLEIHSDGSLDLADHEQLLGATFGMTARIVTSEQRRSGIETALRNFPLTARLIALKGYFTKLELPIWVGKPFFYFDSDVVWLRPVENLIPPGGGNAFSTETWSWYYGVRHDFLWIEAGTPRRVNSGFYHLSQEFPFERMEKLLALGMFNAETYGNTDQEIMAFLFPKMVHYHPEDLVRSRVGVPYQLATVKCAALHFPGGMWREHLDQIKSLESGAHPGSMKIRFTSPVPLTRFELFRMRFYLALSRSELMQFPISSYRIARRFVKG